MNNDVSMGIDKGVTMGVYNGTDTMKSRNRLSSVTCNRVVNDGKDTTESSNGLALETYDRIGNL